jgi:hypothetical protein
MMAPVPSPLDPESEAGVGANLETPPVSKRRDCRVRGKMMELGADLLRSRHASNVELGGVPELTGGRVRGRFGRFLVQTSDLPLHVSS